MAFIINIQSASYGRGTGGREQAKRRKNVTVKWLNQKYAHTGKYYNINNYDKNYDNAWGKTIVKTNMYTYINMAPRVRRPSKQARGRQSVKVNENENETKRREKNDCTVEKLSIPLFKCGVHQLSKCTGERLVVGLAGWLTGWTNNRIE